MTPVANLPPVSTTLVKLVAAGVVDTGGKFAAGVNDADGKLPPAWCTFSREYLREFSKKFEMAVMVCSDAWGKLIHEKNHESKIS